VQYSRQSDHPYVGALFDRDARKARSRQFGDAAEPALYPHPHSQRRHLRNLPDREISGWDGKREDICKAFGETWFEAARSALLFVPSIPARMDLNILINPTHPDAKTIRFDLPAPIWWCDRLYS